MSSKFKICLLILLLLCVQNSAYSDTYIIDASKNAMSHNNEGLVDLREGYYYAAINEFKIAILLCPNAEITGTFYNNLGLAYLRIRNFGWAIQCFEKALEYNPNFIEFYLNLTDAYKGKKSLSKALGKYLKMTNSKNPDPRAWLILGLIYKEMGNTNKALDYLNEFKKSQPDLVLSQAVQDIINTLKQAN